MVYHRPALFRQLLYAVAAAGPAVFQCLYDDDDVETFFIFLIFSRQFSLSLPLPYWSFIVCVLKRLFPFVDSK